MDARFLQQFRNTVNLAAEQLLTVSDQDASRSPAPGKWSKKEIIGHLIDSAANNHSRFVRAQLQEDLVFPGYDQDGWVRLQRYRDCAWTDLVKLWQAYNHHIAFVMASADDESLARPRARHNLHELAWRPVPPTEAATLEYFMRDYVAHLEHHLRQALPAS